MINPEKVPKESLHFAGVDLGLDGSICILDNKCNIIFKTVMPILKSTKSRREYDEVAIRDIFIKYRPEFTCIEKPLLHPVNGKQSYFNSGLAFGIFRGMLCGLLRRYEIISPKRWQKKIFEGLSYKDTKQASIAFCRRFFPEEDFTATERSKKIHDGLCDATNIAIYNYRMNKNG